MQYFFSMKKAIESARTDGDSNDEWYEPNQQPFTEFNSNHTYYRSNVGVAHWSNAGRFTATISAEFAASELNKWPAVGFHVSNESNLDRFYVQKGRSTWLLG